jgi:hypothetical protein
MDRSCPLFVSNTSNIFQPMRIVQRPDGSYANSGPLAGEIKLPSSVETTPITYQGADSRQFVTVVSTGSGLTGSQVTNDEIIAFALPKK